MFDLPIVSKQARDLVDAQFDPPRNGRARPGRRAPGASSAPQERAPRSRREVG